MKNDKIYFDNLDSIRFIAATMVFLHHGILDALQLLPIQHTPFARLADAICSGMAGVSIFFVLSGFLITYLLVTEYERTSRIDLKKFYIRRILRIWPLYYALLLLTFFAYPMAKPLLGMFHPVASDIGYHLTFLSNFDVIRVEKFHSGHDERSQVITWSVSIEEQFYLFWPLLFAFFSKRFWPWLIGLAIFGSLLFRIGNHDDTLVLYFHTFSVLVDLAIGGIFAYWAKNWIRFRNFFEKTGTGWHLFFFAAAFVLLVCSNNVFVFPYGKAVVRIFSALSFALIICSQALTQSESVLNLKHFTFAKRWGKYTYGIYLLHPVAILIVGIIALNMNWNTDTFPVAFGMGMSAFVLTLALSWISYTYFESVFLTYKKRFEIVKTKT